MSEHKHIAIIGGGPAGLMAAEVLSAHGLPVDLYEVMPTVGRKFLYAGKSGMNITHAEPLADFISRYGSRRDRIEPLLRAFSPDHLREWVHGLGIDTFVGSSGRVFPTGMKAAPLLRAWLHRLRSNGVRIHVRHHWQGWDDVGNLLFTTPVGVTHINSDATILALGGGSWARLGSDGSWVSLLEQQGIDIAPLRPANCGFELDWSDYFRERFAGTPLKTVSIGFTDLEGNRQEKQGEFVISETGIEGSLVYALSAPLRDLIEKDSHADIRLDLLPGKGLERVTAELEKPRGSRSIANHLRTRLGIKDVKAALLREVISKETFSDSTQLACAIKSLPLRLLRTRPIDEAISTAGGVTFESLDERLMLKAMPSVFCAGEMLDWEAPTGGYLLTACIASGYAAGFGVINWLDRSRCAEPTL